MDETTKCTLSDDIQKALSKKGLRIVVDTFKSCDEESYPQLCAYLQTVTGIDFTDLTTVEAMPLSTVTAVRKTIQELTESIDDIKVAARAQDLENTKDARDHAEAVADRPLRAQFTFSNLLASYLIVFSTLFCAAMVFLPIPPTNARFADTIIGFLLGTIISTVINFYYGSAMSSGPHTFGKNRK